MTLTPIIIFGSGGQAKVVASILHATEAYQIVGLVTPDADVGSNLHGLRVIANSEDAAELSNIGYGIIAVGDGTVRRKIANALRVARPDMIFPVLIHPTANVEPTAMFSSGTIIHANAYVGVDAVIGVHGLVNTGAQLDHDVQVGDFVSVAPGVVTGGSVTIGDGAFIGVGASIANDITIGDGAIIGAGTAIVRDVPANTRAFRKGDLTSERINE